VGVFLFLHGAAAAVEGIQKLGGELVGHAFFTAGTGVGDQPTDGKGDLAVRTHFHGHLIGGAAHAAGLDFEVGLHVFESLFEGAQRFFAGLFGEDFKSAIENLFGSALLAVVHETVHETGGQAAAINRIRQNFPSGDRTFTGHENSPGNADALRQGLQCYAVSRGGGRPGCLGVFPLRPSRCGGAWTRTHGMTL
jgi:hypothetical protein